MLTSGFTALCESFSNSKNGTDQLTKTLNGYMAALVGEILYNDGDVLKFAGITSSCLQSPIYQASVNKAKQMGQLRLME